MIRVAVVGFGYWGPNLARNFNESESLDLRAVCDLGEERLALAARRYPGIATLSDVEAVLRDPEIDAVALATPVASHYSLGLACLRAGKHLWMEKPFTETVEQAERLVAEAERRSLLLHVDHTFIYTPAVQKIRQIIDEGRLGELYYYDSVRVNLGLFQEDVNVLYDLAVHDLSIMDYVIGEQPLAVSATGMAHIAGRPENVTYLTCFFDSNLIAHVHVNWLAPAKIRRTLIGGARQMIVFDDLEPSEKVRVYDRGVEVGDAEDGTYNQLVGYRTGDMWAPQLAPVEALRVETEHFAACLRDGVPSWTGGDGGLRVMRIIEAASQSMLERGRPVEIAAASGGLR